MIHIKENTKEKAIFIKDSREEKWFNGNCADENLLKELGREGDIIERIQFEDGEHIASILNIYLK